MKNKIVNRYISIVDMIAKTFGNECEIVIHDLTVPQNSVVYTVNNHVTGREVGQSFEHLVTQVLLSQNFQNDCAANYYYKTPDGRVIKSSTSLLRDEDNKVIAAICINIDTNTTSQTLKEHNNFDSAMIGEHPINTDIDSEKTDHIMKIVDDLIDRIIYNKNVSELKREEKLEMVRFMDNKGIFLIKGAIDKVSKKLGISKVTVYSYIDEIRGKR